MNQLRTHCDLPVLMQQVMVCTGFEQGSSYSGDLKDAQKAIPSGTLWAVVITSIVCILYAELICSTCGDRSLVRTEQFLFFFFLQASNCTEKALGIGNQKLSCLVQLKLGHSKIRFLLSMLKHVIHGNLSLVCTQCNIKL